MKRREKKRSALRKSKEYALNHRCRNTTVSLAIPGISRALVQTLEKMKKGTDQKIKHKKEKKKNERKITKNIPTQCPRTLASADLKIPEGLFGSPSTEGKPRLTIRRRKNPTKTRLSQRRNRDMGVPGGFGGARSRDCARGAGTSEGRPLYPARISHLRCLRL